MKAIIYARFSPRRHASECQSIETQLAQCEAYCDRKGYEILSNKCLGHFQDSAVSGKSFKRPGLWAAIKCLKRGWVLVAYSSSRLARNVHLSEYIYAKIAERRACVDLVDEGPVKTDPMSICMRQVRAAFDELDRKMIGKRTRDAARRLQADGIAVSAVAPYGKRPGPMREVVKHGQITSQRTWVDDRPEQAIIERILLLRTLGESLRGIARILNAEGVPARGRKWSHVAIKRILGRTEAKLVAQDAPGIAPTGQVDI